MQDETYNSFILSASFMMLGNIKFVSADNRDQQIMNNKNQDVLFVGSVTYVSDNYFVLSAKDYINTESTSEAIAKKNGRSSICHHEE